MAKFGNLSHHFTLKDKLFFSAGAPVEPSPEEQTASCEGSCFCDLHYTIFKKILQIISSFKSL